MSTPYAESNDAMSTHDEALVTELAELAAESLGWDWDESAIGDTFYPSGPDTIRPEVEAILDRLVEKGWRPPTTPAELQRGASISEPLCAAPLSTGPDAWLLCILHEGHTADHRSGDVTWMGAW